MTPPRLARWLLSMAAASSDRADLLAELDDEFASVAGEDPRRWYWRQARQSLVPLLGQRLRAVAAGPRGIQQDVLFAVRSLRSVPVFTIGVILMLAIGIGAHLAVYAVVDGMLLRPKPFGDRSERLVTLHSTHPTIAPDWDDAHVSYPDLADMRRRATSFESIDAAVSRNVSLSSGTETDRVLAASVTPGLFRALDAQPMLGRTFADADAAQIGFESVVILSSSLWHSLFASDPNVIGRPAFLNGRSLTVVGVMRDGFAFPDGQQMWLPYRGDESDGRANRGLLAIGLLRPSVTVDQARAELGNIASVLAAGYPSTNLGWNVHVMPIREYFVAGKRPTTMLAAVTFVLIVVCANVAGLIIARGIGRERELTLRAALGAGRARLVRLLVVETTLLASIGGALGLLAASWGIRALLAWSPEPPPAWARPEIDLRTGIAAVVLTAIVALAAGLLPAMRISRVDASGALLPGARAHTGLPRHRRLQHWLVGSQVALSVALLVGAGLLTRSATALLTADGGFDPSPLLSARFYIAGDRYDDPSVRGGAAVDVVAHLRSVPGVANAAATGSIPTDDGGTGVRIKDPLSPGDPSREIGIQLTPATATFWDTIDRQLLAGRAFTDAEGSNVDSDVAIINARLARRLWPGESALDHVVQVSEPQPRDGHESGSFAALRVIGVAPDLVYEEFGEETPQSQLMMYVPAARAGWRTQALLIRASSGVADPALLASAIRAEVRRVDPGFAVYDVMTMRDRRGYNHWGERFMGKTATTFAIVALLLAAIGAYAIAAYTVTQRTREIGVRLALGSSRGRVTAGFLSLGGRLALAGGLAGLALALGVARVLQGQLFRVSPWALEEWIAPTLAMAVAVVAATYLPARRASRIDPAVALRTE